MAGKAKDLVGQRFNRWFVVERCGSSKLREAQWLVRCDCGTEKLLSTRYLTSGYSGSCGCYKTDRIRETRCLPDNGAAKKYVIGYYKTSANKRSLSWRMSDNQFLDLVTSNCFYCGQIPNKIKILKSGSFTFNGVDRIDNERGYEVDNVVPCCEICNLAKRNLTYKDFTFWLDQVASYRGMVNSH